MRKTSSHSAAGILLNSSSSLSNNNNSHGNYVDIDQIDHMRQQPDPVYPPYNVSNFHRNYSMNQHHPHTFENHFSLMQTYSGNNLADASPFTKQYSTTRNNLQSQASAISSLTSSQSRGASPQAGHPNSPSSSSSASTSQHIGGGGGNIQQQQQPSYKLSPQLPKNTYMMDNSPIYENQMQMSGGLNRSESPIYSNTNSNLLSSHTNIYSNVVVPNEIPLYSNVRSYDPNTAGMTYGEKLMHNARHGMQQAPPTSSQQTIQTQQRNDQASQMADEELPLPPGWSVDYTLRGRKVCWWVGCR